MYASRNHALTNVVSFNLSEKPEGYVENINTSQQVPTLVYGGVETPPAGKLLPGSTVLVESRVILEFLVDLFPDAGLLPKDPIERAKARFFMETLDARMTPEWGMWYQNKDDGTTYLRLLDTLQALLPTEGFVVGRWSIADAAFLPLLLCTQIIIKTERGYNAKMKDVVKVKTEWESPRFARLRKYFEDSIARPSAKATWDEENVIVEWGKSYGRNM